ncbi:MAG: putative CRISPR-associated protein [Nitrospirae bacterium]|nr:putative CRISPR-associated protein [Nitrospirota bacterium]
MSKLIITTVGTSIRSNKLYPSEFNTYMDALVNGTPLTSVRNIKNIINRTADKVIENFNNNRPNKFLSAEIASLRAFKNNDKLGFSNDDVIALLSTDTEDGKFCAEVNKRVLKELNWCTVLEPMVIKGLKTKKIREDEDISKSFKEAGLNSLKEKVESLLNRQEYTEKYFNITGGFKATIPFITILSFEKGMSLIYLYEESNDLIIISPPETGTVSTYDELIALTSQLGG